MLHAVEITKKFNGRTILDGLNLKVETGERVCLQAPSGAGKTTLMTILAGIDTDFSGRVTDHFEKRGVVFQDPGLFWYKTVRENILYGLDLQAIPWSDQVEKRYHHWLAITGLGGCEHHYPHEISRGMKHKSAIVRTLLTGPDLVLMDEPFSAMDKESIQAIVGKINEFYPDLTLVVASHRMDGCLDFFHRVLEGTATPLSRFEPAKRQTC